MKSRINIIWWIGGRELVEYEIQLEDLQVQSVDGISRAVCKVWVRYSYFFQYLNIEFKTKLIVWQYMIVRYDFFEMLWIKTLTIVYLVNIDLSSNTNKLCRLFFDVGWNSTLRTRFCKRSYLLSWVTCHFSSILIILRTESWCP